MAFLQNGLAEGFFVSGERGIFLPAGRLVFGEVQDGPFGRTGGMAGQRSEGYPVRKAERLDDRDGGGVEDEPEIGLGG